MSDEVKFSPIELRQAGMKPEEIARREDRDVADVESEIRSLLREKYSDDGLTDEDRLTLDRYDTLIRANWVKAVGGDSKALAAIRNIEKDRAKLVADRLTKTRPTSDQALNSALRDLVRKNISDRRNDSLESGDTRTSQNRPTEE